MAASRHKRTFRAGGLWTQLGHPTDTAGVKLRAQSGFFASDHSNECSDTQDKRKSQRSCYRTFTDTNPISM
jgi:hypothetical protein